METQGKSEISTQKIVRPTDCSRLDDEKSFSRIYYIECGLCGMGEGKFV